MKLLLQTPHWYDSFASLALAKVNSLSRDCQLQVSNSKQAQRSQFRKGNIDDPRLELLYLDLQSSVAGIIGTSSPFLYCAGRQLSLRRWKLVGFRHALDSRDRKRIASPELRTLTRVSSCRVVV